MSAKEAGEASLQIKGDLAWVCSLLGQMPVDINAETTVELLANSELDWKVLLNQLQTEGLAPLVYWLLSKSGRFSSIPLAARQELRASYAGTWTQNQKLLKELETLSIRFHEANIPLVLLKGICFALTIYPDIGLRPMADMDLLIPKINIAEATCIAKLQGYEDITQEAFPGLRNFLGDEIELLKKDSHSVKLELHNNLIADRSYTFAAPIDWFWGQTEKMHLSEQRNFENLLILTPSAQLLYSAAHMMLKHGFRNIPLRWYYDLDRLIRLRMESLDWDLILLQA